MMDRTLTLKIVTNAKDNLFNLFVSDEQSGTATHMLNIPFSPDEHSEFNEEIGNEIYSWVQIMMDEEE